MLCFLFFKNPLLSAGRMRFLKKSFNKKSVKKVGSITWPSFGAKFWHKIWPGYWPYHGQVIDPTFLTKKTKNQHLKIIKKPYFYSGFCDQQAKNKKTAPQKTITLAHATITCLEKIPGSTSTFWGVPFFGFCSFWLCLTLQHNNTKKQQQQQQQQQQQKQKNQQKPKTA